MCHGCLTKSTPEFFFILRIQRKSNKTEHSVELLIDNYGSVDVYRYKRYVLSVIRGVCCVEERERSERRDGLTDIPVEKLVESLTHKHRVTARIKAAQQPPNARVGRVCCCGV